MCGRFGYAIPPKATAGHFGLESEPERLEPRWNIAPTQDAACVLRHPDTGQRALRMLRWGLVPHWSKDLKSGARMINARSETAASKPAFRAAFRARRCLVCADAFYEWQVLEQGGKRPWMYRPKGGGPWALAGLWEHWRGVLDEGEAELFTFTILTCPANPLTAKVHDRMPVILAPDAYGAWLDPASERRAVTGLLRPWKGPMEAVPLTRRVNSPANDDPSIREPAPGPAQGLAPKQGTL